MRDPLRNLVKCTEELPPQETAGGGTEPDAVPCTGQGACACTDGRTWESLRGGSRCQAEASQGNSRRLSQGLAGRSLMELLEV